MDWSDFANRKVALLGAGAENMALLPHLQKAGATVALRNREETAAVEEAKKQGVSTRVGEGYLDGLDEYDYVFRIAGMPVSTVAAALEGLENRPVVTSPTDLFLALRPCRIIGVTGTKGKGTTSTMIGSILEAAGHQVTVVGNIGRPIFSIFADLTPDSFAVVELSSFQLEDVRHSPEVAVLLPVTEEHLQPLSAANPNYHADAAAYAAAKANITAFQGSTDLLVFAADSVTARQIADRSSARRLGVGEKDGDVVVDPHGLVTVEGKTLVDLAELGLRGRHIWFDATMAAATTRELAVSVDAITEGLRNFQPLPHRLEVFTTDNSAIRFVDDSYATAPDATISALTAFDDPILLIAGGSPKGVDFTELAEAIAKRPMRAVLLLGTEAPRLQAALEAAGYDGAMEQLSDLSAVVQRAVALAEPGDTVLLSPACASTDMFKGAADRGEQFQQLVREALKKGQ